MTSVLFDAPGPAARRRIVVGSVVAGVVLAGLVFVVAQRLADNRQFESAKWNPLLNPSDENFAPAVAFPVGRAAGHDGRRRLGHGLLADPGHADGRDPDHGRALVPLARRLGDRGAAGRAGGDGHLLRQPGAARGRGRPVAALVPGDRPDRLQRRRHRRDHPLRRGRAAPGPDRGGLRHRPHPVGGAAPDPPAPGLPAHAPRAHQPAGRDPEGHVPRSFHQLRGAAPPGQPGRAGPRQPAPALPLDRM